MTPGKHRGDPRRGPYSALMRWGREEGADLSLVAQFRDNSQIDTFNEKQPFRPANPVVNRAIRKVGKHQDSAKLLERNGT